MIVRYMRLNTHLLRSARRIVGRVHLWLLVAALVVAGGLAITRAPAGAYTSAPAHSQLANTCAGSHAPC